MSAIIPGIISFQNVYQLDMFDISFDIEGIDLTGKTLKCQVRENADSDVVLEFNEDDDSLIKTIVTTNKTTVTFYKDSVDMDIPVLSEAPAAIVYYQLTIIAFTDDSDIEDVETIVKGTMNILPQITIL